MDLQDTREQVEFRTAVRGWLSDHAGEAPERTVLAPQDEAAIHRWREWQARLADAGYAGVTWPQEHGGAGLGPVERVIVDQELEAAGVQGVFDFIGVEMVGPTLIERASAAQCERHLRPLLRGDEVWCQLFSEPGAGSDLANVQTKARQRDDGGWLVNGQKVWTTNAQHAAFGIMLARTDPDAAKHKGLTMFIVPMDTEGITIRPLRQITGDAEFNEVFFDDVVLPEDAVIGEPGDGWAIALTMLGFERLVVGSGLHTVRLDRLADLVSSSASQDDPSVRVRLGKVAAELLSLRYSNYRLLTDIEQGKVPGPEAGLVKITTVLASFEGCRLAADVGGPDALTDEEWGHQVSALPGLRSAGGTEEILRNVIGERVLGLPAEPKVPAPRREAVVA